MKPHKVFSDASVTTNSTTVGIYCDSLSIKYSHTINKPLQVHQAEELALKLAIQLTSNHLCHYFVDNKGLATKYQKHQLSINWLPREFNKQADALTRKSKKGPAKLKPGTPQPLGLANTIQQQYPLNRKLKLISAILGLKTTNLNSIAQHKMGRRLLQSLLTRAEKQDYPSCRKLVNSAIPVKQLELVHMINTYRNGRIARV